MTLKRVSGPYICIYIYHIGIIIGCDTVHGCNLLAAIFWSTYLMGIEIAFSPAAQCRSCLTTLEWIEYGIYKEYVRVLAKIILFYQLQDGCRI